MEITTHKSTEAIKNQSDRPMNIDFEVYCSRRVAPTLKSPQTRLVELRRTGSNRGVLVISSI
jgi:hypothetical protein